jgi:hypothetical protein
MSRRLLILLVSIIWIIWGVLGTFVGFGLERCIYYAPGENALCPIVTFLSNTPLIFTWIFPFNLIFGLIFIFGLAFLMSKDINENKNFSHFVSALLIIFLGGFGGIIYLIYTQIKMKTISKPKGIFVDKDL